MVTIPALNYYVFSLSVFFWCCYEFMCICSSVFCLLDFWLTLIFPSFMCRTLSVSPLNLQLHPCFSPHHFQTTKPAYLLPSLSMSQFFVAKKYLVIISYYLRNIHIIYPHHPEERSLMAEGSASHSTFGDSRTHKKPCVLSAQRSSGAIGYYLFFNICWCQAIKGFVCEEEVF